MPIHWSSEVHWTLAVAYPQELKIVYFDPMLEPDEQTSKAALEALDDLVSSHYSVRSQKALYFEGESES